MLYVEAPNERNVRGEASIFLAGGITGCPDWQQEACSILSDFQVTVFNPRRADFDVTRGDSAAQQVEWEYRYLRRAYVTMFWFPACDPAVTVQPIALFELGAAIEASLANGRHFVVGAAADYPRRLDIELQMANAVPSRLIYDSLYDTAAAALGRALIG